MGAKGVSKYKSVQDFLEINSYRDPNSGCWIWLLSVDDDGYGRACHHLWGLSSRLAHRVSYEAHQEKIPPDKEIDHLCGIKCCINPAHLEPVTHDENIARGVARGTFRAGNAKKKIKLARLRLEQ